MWEVLAKNTSIKTNYVSDRVGVNKEPLENTSKSQKKHTLLIHHVGHRGEENINRWFVSVSFNVSSTQALHLDDDSAGLLFILCISNLVCILSPKLFVFFRAG